MNKMVAAFFAGLIFGIGLIVAQMTNPAKVIGFLNFAGGWDPSLMLVMAGGLVVFTLAYRLSTTRTPYLSPQFVLPDEKVITRKLVIGSIVFGVGWGLGGFCPGPAVVSAAFGEPKAWVFFLSMLAGMHLFSIGGRRPRHIEDPLAAMD